MDEQVRGTEIEVLSERWGTLSMHAFDFRRSDGTWQHQHREVYNHGNAAAILLCDPLRGTVVLVRQFRYPPHLNGDSAHLVEVVAGLLDGDAPEACALREAEEEAGVRIETAQHLFDTYVSPGSLTEKVSLFLGLYGPEHRVAAGGGLHHEGEDIEVLEVPFQTALAMIESGEIVDAKTILLLHYAALKGVFDGASR